MSQLPDTRTSCTPQQLVDALVSIWPGEFGEGQTPSIATACVLASQWALETADGTSMVQWNIGNFKRPPGVPGDYTMFPTKEWINGVETTISPPDPGCRFACYASLEDGVQAWLRSLYTRWTLAWPGAAKGDPAAFAQGLHDQKPPYYTAPVQSYIAGMKRYFDVFMKTLHVPATAPTDPVPADVATPADVAVPADVAAPIMPGGEEGT
jgi:hypothetical protein